MYTRERSAAYDRMAAEVVEQHSAALYPLDVWSVRRLIENPQRGRAVDTVRAGGPDAHRIVAMATASVSSSGVSNARELSIGRSLLSAGGAELMCCLQERGGYGQAAVVHLCRKRAIGAGKADDDVLRLSSA